MWIGFFCVCTYRYIIRHLDIYIYIHLFDLYVLIYIHTTFSYYTIIYILVSVWWCVWSATNVLAATKTLLLYANASMSAICCLKILCLNFIKRGNMSLETGKLWPFAEPSNLNVWHNGRRGLSGREASSMFQQVRYSTHFINAPSTLWHDSVHKESPRKRPKRCTWILPLSSSCTDMTTFQSCKTFISLDLFSWNVALPSALALD